MKRKAETSDYQNSKRPRRQCVISNKPEPFPYVLTVIDMQPTFSASNDDETLENVKDLIVGAKNDKAYIVLAHYMKFGKTHDKLLTLVEKYKHKSLVYANKNDKSGAIMTKIIKKRIRAPYMKVCGVNTDACVQASVKGLSRKLPEWNIKVIKDSCNSSWSYGNKEGIEYMSKLSNVTIH